MNVLQVNNVDLPGRRFNGYDLSIALRNKGHVAGQAVLVKFSDDPNVRLLAYNQKQWEKVIELERKHSMHDMLFPYGRLLLDKPRFQEADVVHFHLIQNYLLSLFDLPDLFRAKPSVWTWHDPWAVTGHCVHPRDCQLWRSGCHGCPRLEENFPLREDYAAALWELKRETYQKLDVDIVVSSDFMLDYARNGPLGQCFQRVHKIPFGIRLEEYGLSSRENARRRFSIPKDNFVIACRWADDEYKGCKYIKTALEKMEKRRGVTLLTVGYGVPPASLRRKFHTVSLGWIDDPKMLADFYTACDVFLMPSIAESFGLMAIEAMASSRPVVCFGGTALPAVTFAPECGIAVPKGDDGALQAAIERLREHPEEARARGELGRRISEREYRFKHYVNRHEELYEEIIERRKESKNGGK